MEPSGDKNNELTKDITITVIREEPVQEKEPTPTPESEPAPMPEPQPTPTPEPQPSCNYGIVTASTLNLREGASITSKIIGTIPAGKVVKWLEEVNGWYKVDYNGKVGYVSTKYVSSVPDPSKVTVAKSVKVIVKSGLNVRVSSSVAARKIGQYHTGQN